MTVAAAGGLTVAVLAGGRSSEHDVSLSSGAAIADGLRSSGHLVIPVEIGRDGVWRREGSELQLSPGRGLEGADVVFPALHGPFGEDGSLQGLLEMIDVAYAGAGVEASALCMDKVLFKSLMAQRGIAQVAHCGLSVAEWRTGADRALERLRDLGMPVFVKPARLGSSIGIVKVDGDEGELRAAVESAFGFDELVIVEAASNGIEVECALLERADGTVQASHPGRIESAAEWYDYDSKYREGGMTLTVPADLAPHVSAEVAAVAQDAFAAAGCEGLARVDFFVEGERVLLNELNTMPGFTPYSVYPQLLAASGVSFAEIVDRLCHLAVARHARRAAVSF